MCGIYGGYWQGIKEAPKAQLSKAKRLLQHRGPDDCGLDSFFVSGGILALGHTRLSIIDLSINGHQPMRSKDGRYSIVFNGEIYNYRELREELKAGGHTFQTDSDTEVLLACWAQWGTDCLKNLIGMFAFAVYDSCDKTLTLVRDAFGIKPLFYAISKESNNFIFSSEMPAMLSILSDSAQINAQRAYDYLIYQVQDRGFETFIDGVNHVPPAHWLQINLGNSFNVVTERWWNPTINQASTLSFKDAASHLRELFLDSVKLHLRSDVPLGVALSGGLDSSAITCAIRYLEPEIELHTFSYVAARSSFSEESWVDIVNKYINAIPHKIMVNPGDLERDIKSLIQVQGEPFCTTSMYAQYRVFNEAKNAGIKVVLEGQGADELLAGYHGYQGQRMRSLFEQRKFLDMLLFSYHWRKWPGREKLSPWRALIGQLIPDNLYKILQAFSGQQTLPSWMNKNSLEYHNINIRPIRLGRKVSASGRRVIEALFRAVSEGGLPSLLRYGDRNAMNFSIENRVPFLTLPLAEFLISLPEKYLISEDGQTKSIFRAAMRGIVPDEVIDRRDKVGFETPMGDWASNLASEVSWLDKSSKRDYLWNEKKISKHFNSIINNKQVFNAQDWRLLNLKLWMQIYLHDNS